MYEVTVVEHFCAAHFLRGYGGKCENMHGHNYRVELTIAGSQLDSVGMLYDFAYLRNELEAFLEKWDHKVLNEIKPFIHKNPTAENLAREICTAMAKELNFKPRNTLRCDVWETERSRGSYIWGRIK
jgi:6-pyruvoyltetrahydropterin/6-carboxytetrahydropterin synthase